MRIVPFTPAHFATLASWFASESDVVQWGGEAVTYPLDDGQLRAMLDEGLSEPPARLCWMAEENSELVGHAQLRLDWRHGTATMARVAIAPSARGRGLAPPMLKLVVDEAFALPDFERVELNVYRFNEPAIRAYASLGFAKEGVRRSSTRVGDERWDTVIMAMLRPEWTERQ